MSEVENQHPKITGVFSTQEIKKVGTGTTTRKTVQKAYWYATEKGNQTIEIQPLNANYIPAGQKKNVTKDDFLARFKPEPEFYVRTVFPKIREVNKTVARAERHLGDGATFSAEYEFGNALQVDVENVRANFGLGLTYLSRGDSTKADDIFERLVRLDAAFEPEHKHLFNEFGISLRKSKMYDQAIAYYTRALALEKEDENIHFNLGRVYLEQKKYDLASDHLLTGLKLNSASELGKKFYAWMRKKNLFSKGKIREAEALLNAPQKAPEPATETSAETSGTVAKASGSGNSLIENAVNPVTKTPKPAQRPARTENQV